MLTLYHAPHSRSSMILWLLEELGQPYQIEITPIVYGNGSGAPAPESYRRIHPHKKVPALDHDGTIVFECAGIALYLGDAFPAAGLAPAAGDKARGLYSTLIAYWAGPLNAIGSARFAGWDKDKPTGFGTVAEMEAYLQHLLQNGPYLLGGRFSTLDVLYGSAIGFYKGSVLSANPLYDEYLARVTARPAAERARARDNG